MANAAIDWNDFVVVETIDFFDHELEEVPPPPVDQKESVPEDVEMEVDLI